MCLVTVINRVCLLSRPLGVTFYHPWDNGRLTLCPSALVVCFAIVLVVCSSVVVWCFILRFHDDVRSAPRTVDLLISVERLLRVFFFVFERACASPFQNSLATTVYIYIEVHKEITCRHLNPGE